MVTEIAYLVFLLLLALERMLELRISKRNAAWAFSQGGIEVGQRHFVFMKLLHTAFFFACAAEVWWLGRSFVLPLGAVALGVALTAQFLRYWAIRSLGHYWNVRVIVVPGHRAVVRGPYRFMRHPNYVAVILEGLAVPLIHGAYLTAIGFTLLNALLLTRRIRCEEAALHTYCAYDEQLGKRARFLPMAKGGPA